MISIRVEAPDGAALPAARPGQYLTLRIQPADGQRSLLRNYSLSGPPDAGYYRIARQARAGGRRQRLSAHAARRRRPTRRRRSARHLHPRPDRGARAADQRRDRRHPGSGHARRARRRSTPSGRSGGCTARAAAATTSFAAEARACSPPCRTCACTCATAVRVPTTAGRDFDSPGRLTASLLAELEPPRDAEAYLCGPVPFMDEISAGLAAIGLDGLAHPHRAVRAGARPDARHRGGTGARAAPARRRARNGPDDRVRAQRPHRPLEQRLRQPARARRGLRRRRSAGPVAPASATTARATLIAGERRLRPRPGRAARRGERAHLLLPAAQRRRARSVTGVGYRDTRRLVGVQRRMPTAVDRRPGSRAIGRFSSRWRGSRREPARRRAVWSWQRRRCKR